MNTVLLKSASLTVSLGGWAVSCTLCFAVGQSEHGSTSDAIQLILRLCLIKREPIRNWESQTTCPFISEMRLLRPGHTPMEFYWVNPRKTHPHLIQFFSCFLLYQYFFMVTFVTNTLANLPIFVRFTLYE